MYFSKDSFRDSSRFFQRCLSACRPVFLLDFSRISVGISSEIPLLFSRGIFYGSFKNVSWISIRGYPEISSEIFPGFCHWFLPEFIYGFNLGFSRVSLIEISRDSFANFFRDFLMDYSRDCIKIFFGNLPGFFPEISSRIPPTIASLNFVIYSLFFYVILLGIFPMIYLGILSFMDFIKEFVRDSFRHSVIDF